MASHGLPNGQNDPTVSDDAASAAYIAELQNIAPAFQLQPSEPSGGKLAEFRQAVPSWLTSLLLHLGLILALALWTLPLTSRQPTSLNASPTELEEVAFEEIVDIHVDPVELDADDSSELVAETDFESAELDLESLAAAEFDVSQPAQEVVDFDAAIGELELTAVVSGMSGSGLEGRSRRARSRMTLKGGGSTESEKAVADALAWIARHQLSDGSWNFDHRGGQCQGQCGNPGDLDKSPAGATGLALLPFLGAGNTHRDGKYRDAVERGAYALVNLLKITENGATVVDEGKFRMYCHGIATMALCESFAMTGDEALRAPAQAALAYTCYAQDPNGGGWRYEPQEPGDTSMHGWHVGALKSGFMASLDVPPIVVERASQYLDRAEVDGGEGYYYFSNAPKYGAATSAIGLLCRMYFGVDRNNAALKKGIERLVEKGPDRGANGAYFNYYAAQAIFQYTGGEGPLWKKWNDPMRDFLVSSQETKGHEAGSWAPTGENARDTNHGGRLFQTAMSCMTLEVYYRLMPIYGSQATEAGFE